MSYLLAKKLWVKLVGFERECNRALCGHLNLLSILYCGGMIVAVQYVLLQDVANKLSRFYHFSNIDKKLMPPYRIIYILLVIFRSPYHRCTYLLNNLSVRGLIMLELVHVLLLGYCQKRFTNLQTSSKIVSFVKVKLNTNS